MQNKEKILLISLIIILSSIISPASNRSTKDIEITNRYDIVKKNTSNLYNIVNLTNTEFQKRNITFNEGLIDSRNISLSYSVGFTSINTTITTPQILLYNFSSIIIQNLEQINLVIGDTATNTSITIPTKTNSPFIAGELSIFSAPTILIFNISVIDSPVIFPLNLTARLMFRDIVSINQSGNYFSPICYPEEVNVFKFDPLPNQRQISLVFNTKVNYLWNLEVYNETGSVIKTGTSNHWIANPNEVYYFSVTSKSNLSYDVLFRVESPTYKISLQENTTLIQGQFLYYNDAISLLFNVKADQQLRFTENGSRQLWAFSNADTNQTYWQNWYYKVQFPFKVFTWKATTLGQIIDTDGNYSLQLTEKNGNQFIIKVTLHDTQIDTTTATTYHGEMFGPEDFEYWMIDLAEGETIKISSTGDNFQLQFLNPNKKGILSTTIGGTLEYKVMNNGTYFIEVLSTGSTGPYDLTISVTKPSSGISFLYSILALGSIFILVLLSLGYFLRKKRSKKES